jgi:HSP20 family protein
MKESKDFGDIFYNFEKRIEDLFSDIIDVPWGRCEEISWHPAVDMYETDAVIVIVVDLPGVMPEDVRVIIEGNTCTLCGQRSREHINESHRFLHIERQSGRFSRTVMLESEPQDVDIEKKVKDGVMTVIIRKKTHNSNSEKE